MISFFDHSCSRPRYPLYEYLIVTKITSSSALFEPSVACFYLTSHYLFSDLSLLSSDSLSLHERHRFCKSPFFVGTASHFFHRPEYRWKSSGSSPCPWINISHRHFFSDKGSHEQESPSFLLWHGSSRAGPMSAAAVDTKQLTRISTLINVDSLIVVACIGMTSWIRIGSKWQGVLCIRSLQLFKHKDKNPFWG